MDMANLILAGGLFILTGIASVAALVQARTAVSARDDAVAAQASAESARDEAVQLARNANASFQRQADAQERANQIALESAAQTDLKFSSIIDGYTEEILDGDDNPIDFQRLTCVVVNRGRGVAYDLRVSVKGAEDQKERELGALKLDQESVASFNALAPSVGFSGLFIISWKENPERQFVKEIEFGPEVTVANI